MKRWAEVKITHLELTPVSARPRDLPPGMEVRQVPEIDIATYRRLYNEVGRDWHWIDRNRIPDEELHKIIRDARVLIYLLIVDGEPAGFCELDARSAPDVEIVYFGLLPRFIGRGIGAVFLDRIVGEAATRGNRVWLHTCTLDHPAALSFYRNAGFVPFKTEVRTQELRPDARPGTNAPPDP